MVCYSKSIYLHIYTLSGYMCGHCGCGEGVEVKYMQYVSPFFRCLHIYKWLDHFLFQNMSMLIIKLYQSLYIIFIDNTSAVYFEIFALVSIFAYI